ncbi:evolved beta-galactosidase subunit beta [Actinomyces ruminicola]|uniref:Evolved beta-galactosidase subunit beta n=1 Tax=Actinomyces ruminicola TaxID=332524 RepID=A0A1H0FJ35_9ACTO|nr:hypothetical protein [Actinomyces ruminicola]SDN94683.1 evolved beta-galactosidase subunit beta [Actinomyces ruminicola]
MRLFPDLDSLARERGAAKKWLRTCQAIDHLPALRPAVAYSLGDSLTYWKDSTQRLLAAWGVGDGLVASRRYLNVLHAVDADLTVQVVPVAVAPVRTPYDDLTDREVHEPAESLRTVTVPAGGIGVVDVSEAFRLLPGSGDAAIIRVTVEEASFPNK